MAAQSEQDQAAAMAELIHKGVGILMQEVEQAVQTLPAGLGLVFLSTLNQAVTDRRMEIVNELAAKEQEESDGDSGGV